MGTEGSGKSVTSPNGVDISMMMTQSRQTMSVLEQVQQSEAVLLPNRMTANNGEHQAAGITSSYLLFRGLRVRIGMASGTTAAAVSLSKAGRCVHCAAQHARCHTASAS